MPARQYDSRVRKPIREVVDGIQFDSQFEAAIYKDIRVLFSADFIKCHQPIAVLSGNKHFPPLNWKCDFRLDLPWKKSPIYVEAKGVYTREFKLLLQALAYTRPYILDNLIVVSDEVGRKIGLKIQTVSRQLMFETLIRLKG